MNKTFTRKPLKTGIYNKISRVFLLQMLFISLVTIAGVYIAQLVIEQVMVRKALENEAEHYWRLLESNPQQALPNTANLSGFLITQGQEQQLPKPIQNLSKNFTRITFQTRNSIVYFEEQGEQRLYLLFSEQSVRHLAFYFGVVPLSLALMVIYLSAWFAYRASRHSLSPMVALAQTMRQFDARYHDLDSLHLTDYMDFSVNDEVRTLAISLQDFTQRLQQQLEREQEFTHDVSHELRTPLAVIQGSLELLAKQEKQTAVQQRAIQRMQSTSQDMQAIIDILLLLAREQDHKHHKRVNINQVLSVLIQQVEETHNADQHVQLRLEAHSQLTLHAPQQAIAIVLGNLLRNACNYTHTGIITAKIAADHVSIKDTGLGISSQDIERVQRPFERSHQHIKGHGLGLDIVKRLCERYEWQLNISSELGEGTCVTIYFTTQQPA